MSKKNSEIIDYMDFIKSSKKPLIRPGLWKWTDIKKELYGSLSEGTMSENRAAVSLVNKDTGDVKGVSPNINAVVQVLKPGERDTSHKHTNLAIFLVFQGEGYSIIEGEKLEWTKGDVLFAPAWLEHEHCNTSEDEDAILYTIQDVPQVSGMGNWFIEEPVGTSPQHIVKKSDK